ncbi:hypothetical protein BC941DRAFT_436254 [Chlamydoabsidia padenii]|nr:hypothetical protein BC941DRAFT_436254 [Chlamydoabsidia padenii]
MDSDTDDNAFVTPPTSPLPQHLEEGDSIELMEWKMDTIEKHLEKLEEQNKVDELNYKRIEAQKSTKAKRWKLNIVNKLKRKGDTDRHDPALGVRSVTTIEKKEPLRRVKPAPIPERSGPSGSGTSKVNLGKQHGDNKLQQAPVSSTLQHQEPCSAPVTTPPTNSGSTTTGQQPKAPINLTSVSSRPLPFNPVVIKNEAAMENPKNTIRKEQTRQAEKLYNQVTTNSKVTQQSKKAKHDTPNNQPINNVVKGSGIQHGQTPINSGATRNTTHFFQNQLPATISATKRPQNNGYMPTRPYGDNLQHNFSYQLNDYYLQNYRYQYPSTTNPPATHSYYSHSTSMHRRTSPPPPPPPKELSPPVIPPPPPPPPTTSFPTYSSSQVANKQQSPSSHSDKVLKKQKYQSPLATFGIQTTPQSKHQGINQPLCVFEAEGGVCNDDTCHSKHFRDF